ncbi:hypothetical protein CHARACLAT_025444 [Characodon lateralis]|uniref:Uncharacterized protein n=1 Tax=Characodon lateralis TaxID=208331 RepID=A0ABU7EPW1_9TELE|nr:hypothetical protein [Characodon lateralis]
MKSTWDYTSSSTTSTTQDPVCRFQAGLQHHQTRHPPPEAHPAQSASLQLNHREPPFLMVLTHGVYSHQGSPLVWLFGSDQKQTFFFFHLVLFAFTLYLLQVSYNL